MLRARPPLAWTPIISRLCNVRIWHKADIARLSSNVRFWGAGSTDPLRCLLLTQRWGNRPAFLSGKVAPKIVPPRPRKRVLASDLDTVMVDSLKALDLIRPIREADIL